MRGSEVSRLAGVAATHYEAERERLEQAGAQLERDLADLAAREVQAWEQLTVTLVPGLVAEHLDWAANLLHLPTIASAEVQRRIATEREATTSEIARIEGEPDFIERELKLNACAIEIAELDRSIEPLRQSTSPLESEYAFRDLCKLGYDTPAYRTKWYELAYYRHWKHGDRLVEWFGESRGLKTFAELRARYEEEAEARRTLEAERARWVAERSRIEALAARHARLGEALQTLEDRHWAQTRARVHEHLAELASEDVLKLVGSYEAGLYAAKRVAGIAAKRRYLSAMRDEWITKPHAKVSHKLSKALRGVTKYSSPKRANLDFDGAEMQRKYTVPRASWDKRWRKVDTARRRIVDFDRYDAFDVADTTIWWHLMTDGDVKARFIPDVASYYDGARDGDEARDLAVAALADEALSAAGNEHALDDWS